MFATTSIHTIARSRARSHNHKGGHPRRIVTGIPGYARVSTGDQDLAGQTMRLTQAGAIRVFTDVRSGRTMDRPGLQELLAYTRKGDTLAVVRLDRLGRSLGELLTIVTMLRERGIALLDTSVRWRSYPWKRPRRPGPTWPRHALWRHSCRADQAVLCSHFRLTREVEPIRL